jgi:phosphate/sulfate permease
MEGRFMTDISALVQHLPPASVWLLGFVFLLIVLQEGINGFHDTANAVTTVIYSNSLKPDQAITVSIIFNFLGVLLGGTAVAFSMVFLLPKEMVAGINTINEASLMLALVLTAVVWNLTTWWYGIPNSTTHTYVGAIIGVSMAHAFLVGTPVANAMNWVEGEKVILTLFLSPLLGAVLAWLGYKAIKRGVKDPAMFEPHKEGVVPSRGIRGSLIGGLVGVSFLHGTNDGQKSIGLMLMVLMGMLPGLYAIDPVKDQASYQHVVATIKDLESIATTLKPNQVIAPHAEEILDELSYLRQIATREFDKKPLTEEEKIEFRKEILDMHEAVGRTLKTAQALKVLSHEERQKLRKAHDSLTRLVENVPFWLILLSSIALGIGTGVGYKKIVATLGSKMGDKPMSPAQGLAAQMAAVVSIAAGDISGAPVSTTHVLTSGVAGTVVSAGDHLQWSTLRAIVITWFTTLPGTMLISFAMGILLHTALV